MNKWLPVLVLPWLIGCDEPPSRCAAVSATPHQIVTLYFGRGGVSDAAWRDFLDRAITPNLPDGYTVLDATGAWMNPQTRVTAREASKMLVVALPEATALSPIERIRQAYKDRFNQISVGMTVQPGCGSF